MKLITSLFALVFVLGLVSGCGNENQNSTPQNNGGQVLPPGYQDPNGMNPGYGGNPPGPSGGPGYGNPAGPVGGPGYGGNPPGPSGGPGYGNPVGPVGGPGYGGNPPGPSGGPGAGPVPPAFGPGPGPYPVDPNYGYLPPQGVSVGYSHYQSYFQRLHSPYGPQPVFAEPGMANQWARTCYKHRINMYGFNSAFYYFSSFNQVVSHPGPAPYPQPLFNSTTTVRIVVEVYRVYPRFDVHAFHGHYQNCLNQGLVGVPAIQQAFVNMNINININNIIY